MAANKTIGGINVTITAGITNFAKNISKARSIAGGFSKTLKGLAFNLKTLGAALAIGGVTKLVADQFKAISGLKDLSDKTGVSTDKLAGLQLAAREAGVSNSLLERSLVKLNNEMGMSGDKALTAWIEKTSKLSTQQERLNATTAMFGSKGTDMVRFLNGGTAALVEAQLQAEKTGQAISMQTAFGVDRALESFDRLKDNVGGIFRSMAAESWPYLQAMVDMTNSAISSGGGKSFGTFIVDVLANMAKSVVDGINWMVGQVVKSVGDFAYFVAEWRTTTPAQTLGFGFANDQEKIRSKQSALNIRSAGLGYINNPPSALIDKLVADARRVAAEAAAKAVVNGPDILDMAGGFAKKFLGPSAQSWMGAGKGLGGGIAQRFGWMAQAASMMKAPGQMAQRPALSFAESGSVESYRQQAAIRRSSEDIAKKQLGVQQQIRDGIENLADVINFPAANLGKG